MSLRRITILRLPGMDRYTFINMRRVGIKMTEDLLEEACTKDRAKLVSMMTFTSYKRLVNFVNASDLFRIPFIGTRCVMLLHRIGCMNIRNLRDRDMTNLYYAIQMENKLRPLMGRNSSLCITRIQYWVKAAQNMQILISH